MNAESRAVPFARAGFDKSNRVAAVADATPRPAIVLWTVAIALALGLVAALRAYLRRGSLWEDELIAITHTNQALPQFFIEVLRNDIHPPLYFLQLDAWMALGPQSDAWALANSLFWATISLATMFFVAQRLHGPRAAWIATALLSVLPSFAWSAGTLRMYAGVPACVLLVYFAHRRWFDTRERRYLVLGFVAGLVTAYVHAIEFFFVAFIVGGALVEAYWSGSLRAGPSVASRGRSLWTWAAVQVFLGLCLLPLALSALVRGSDASAPTSAAAMLGVGGALVAGWKTSALGWARGAGTVVFVMLVAAALFSRESRWRTIAIPLAALVIATAIGTAIKPIFKQPVFAANLLPFVILGAAAAAAQSRRIAACLVLPCLVALALVAIPMVDRQAQGEAYASAAHAVRDRAAPGDLVVVPNVSVFWGVARYAIAPDWGPPLGTMPPLNAEWARLNQRIATWFGEAVPERLGLVPARHVIVSAGVRYLIGSDALAESADAPHVWLVTRERYVADVQLDPRLRASTSAVPETYGDGELIVRRFDRVDAPPARSAP